MWDQVRSGKSLIVESYKHCIMDKSNEHTNPEAEIVSMRIFPTSREILFKAFSDPHHLAQWWGPHGFSNTFHEFNFEVGGEWRYTMHGPEKGNYENHCAFTQIIVPQLIVWKRFSKPLFQVMFIFESISSTQTKLIFKMIFDTVEECNKLKPYVVDKNEENFDRLLLQIPHIY